MLPPVTRLSVAPGAVVELDTVARADREALPVDDAVAGRLIDRQPVCRAGDRALSGDVLTAGRQCAARMGGRAGQRDADTKHP